MTDELRRAIALIGKGDMRGERSEPFRFGALVSTPSLPQRHDSNYVLVERPETAGADELAREAERLQHGLGHRLLVLFDETAGARLAPRFRELGWRVDEHVLMARHRPPERTKSARLTRGKYNPAGSRAHHAPVAARVSASEKRYS